MLIVQPNGVSPTSCSSVLGVKIKVVLSQSNACPIGYLRLYP